MLQSGQAHALPLSDMLASSNMFDVADMLMVVRIARNSQVVRRYVQARSNREVASIKQEVAVTQERLEQIVSSQ